MTQIQHYMRNWYYYFFTRKLFFKNVQMTQIQQNLLKKIQQQKLPKTRGEAFQQKLPRKKTNPTNMKMMPY